MENVITVVNNVKIIELENSLFPVKPICDALGVDSSSQYKKIKSDKYLKSHLEIRKAKGANNKEYDMLCLSTKYLVWWLLTINPKNVKNISYEIVEKNKIDCYNSIMNHVFPFLK